MIYFFIPTFRPAGGVIKVLDYLNHTLESTLEVALICPEKYVEDLPLFSVPNFVNIPSTIRIITPLQTTIKNTDFIFFSLPTDFNIIRKIIPFNYEYNRLIHIIQNVRHTNPDFQNGLAIRLLGKPMHRISITKEVENYITPYIKNSISHICIIEGHNTPYFKKERSSFPSDTLKIGYTTWKSELGIRVENQLAGKTTKSGRRIEFKSIRGVANWQEIRELYHWSDVFLAAPSEEEGFYLPGLEAMAAGCIFLTPNVGGNMAYCKFDENCIQVKFEDQNDYVNQINLLDNFDIKEILNLRKNGYQISEKHDLASEKKQYLNYLKNII